MKILVKKAMTMVLTLFFVSVVTFSAFQVINGDVVTAKLGVDATKEQVEELKEEYGLNKSIPVRYAEWLQGAIRGDFGDSYSYNVPVGKLVAERMEVTVGLGLIAILLIIIVALPLGILASRTRNGIGGHIINTVNQIFMSIPHFFLGMLICLLFGIFLKWFTPGDYVSLKDSVSGYFGYMIFPAIAIAIPKIAMLVKFLKTSVIRQMNQDYVRTARSKGNSEKQILYHHVLRNALIPVLTFLAMVIAEVLAGSIVLEPVFNLPGLGRLLVVSISSRDYPVVQVIVLYIAAVVIVMNCIVDILYQYLDPRVKDAL